MKEKYDLSTMKSRKNPYVSKLKQTATQYLLGSPANTAHLKRSIAQYRARGVIQDGAEG